MEEIWADVKDYEGLYQVSNLGRIKSTRYSRLMVPCKDYRGYLTVQFTVKGKIKRFKIHRLVAQAFIPNPNNLPQVNHKDENKTNNIVDNLEWCTNEYNYFYGTAQERRLKTMIENKKENPEKYKNKKNYNRTDELWQKKKVVQYDLNGNTIRRWDSMKEAAKELKIVPQSISKCCRGLRKTAKGYIWKYEQ